MNDGGGDGAGCFDIKEWADTTELTNVEVTGLGKCSYLVGKRKVFIKTLVQCLLYMHGEQIAEVNSPEQTRIRAARILIAPRKKFPCGKPQFFARAWESHRPSNQ